MQLSFPSPLTTWVQRTHRPERLEPQVDTPLRTRAEPAYDPEAVVARSVARPSGPLDPRSALDVVDPNARLSFEAPGGVAAADAGAWPVPLAGAQPSPEVVASRFVGVSWGFKSPYMIVSRSQDHMVETQDGRIHMLINRGLDWGLQFLSSEDGGRTWSEGLRIAGTTAASTSDLRLLSNGDSAAVAYVTADAVMVGLLRYDEGTGDWSVAHTSVAHAVTANASSILPTVAVGDQGRVFVSYTEETAFRLSLVVTWSDDGGRTWTTPPPTTLAGAQVATARVISAAGDFGVLVATDVELAWHTYSPSVGWTVVTLEMEGTLGLYANHFSATVEGEDVYVVNAQLDGDLSFLRYDAGTNLWSTSTLPAPGVDVTRAQISLADDGAIYLTYDDVSTGELVVTCSRDQGSTWTTVARLATPQGWISPPTRFEAPEHFSGDLVVTQQVDLPGVDAIDALWVHVVDLDGSGDASRLAMSSADADAFVF